MESRGRNVLNPLDFMKATRPLLLFSVVFAAGLSLQIAGAEPFTQAEVSQIFNEVKTLDASGARPSKIRETIQGAQSVKTGLQSRAELTFPDKSLTRLGGNTIFSFQQGTRELELKQGTILFEVPKGNGGAKIRTASITAAITGTTGFYEYSPKAGADGIIKFGILEGSATLFIKGRLGHFITIGEGQMVICSAKLRDFNSTDVVYFEIEPFLRTCALITRMGGLPEPSLLLVERAIANQGHLFNRSKELFLTNLFIPGGGTEVFLTDIDRRFTANNPLATPPSNPRPKVSGQSPQPVLFASQPTPGQKGQTSGSSTSQPTQTPNQTVAQITPQLGASTPSKFGPLPTITSPNPYVINSTTQILSDPKITTNGVDDFGTSYRNSALDGPLADYQFGSTSSFDQSIQYGTFFPTPAAGIANFKFSNLIISGPPSLTINGGPAEIALISVGGIASAAPGGTFNLDAFDGLFLGTVNGSIKLGPELSFTSSGNGNAPDTFDFTSGSYSKGLYLELYARGPASDVVFGSNVTFTGNRGLRLEAEHNIEISGSVSTSFLSVSAGNLFILDPTAQITTGTFKINNAADVQANGSAFVSATGAEVTIQNPATVAQSTGFVNVNSLPFAIGSLQSLTVTSNSSSSGVTVSTNISTPKLLNLSLNSNLANLTILGAITVNNFNAFAPDLVIDDGSALFAQSVSIYLYNATVGITQSSGLNIRGLFTDTTSLSNLTVHGNQISVTSDLTLVATTSNPGGTSLTLNGDSVVNASGNLHATALSLVGNSNVTGNAISDNDLAFTNLTAATVSANTLSAYPFAGTTYSLSAGSVNAPGGFQQFNGADGAVAFAPTDGLGLNLRSTSQVLAFATPGPSSPPLIGASTFNGGNAAAASAFAGGNGGFLHVISDPGISVEVPLAATTGMNGNSVPAGGAGGTVILQSAGSIAVSSSIDVSSNAPATHRVSASGGNITVASTATTGTAINVTSTGALRSLLNAAAPGPGGIVQITASGGNIVFNGTATADRGTVLIQNNGLNGTISHTGAVISADIVKLGALGDNGQLIIGGGSINANSVMKLYAGGSNGTVDFVDDVTLSGGTKIIAANTVTIEPTKTVTVTGSRASVYANNQNFVGGTGAPPTAGKFQGSGAPNAGSTHSFTGVPAF